MKNKIYEFSEKVRAKNPLVHAITNPISINQCANTILALGARAIMAEHPGEVCQITKTADALMLNIGNITDARMESIRLSLAFAENIPSVLDVVGVACSKLRRDYVLDLLREKSPTVIKGNYSEITAIAKDGYWSCGIDADGVITPEDMAKTAKALAKKYKTTILATGKTDIITDGNKIACVKNGTKDLAGVTGTGCMLGAMCAVFLTVADGYDSAVACCCYFGICGELAKTDKGNGSFMVNLIDKISTLSQEEIVKYTNMEEC